MSLTQLPGRGWQAQSSKQAAPAAAAAAALPPSQQPRDALLLPALQPRARRAGLGIAVAHQPAPPAVAPEQEDAKAQQQASHGRAAHRDCSGGCRFGVGDLYCGGGGVRVQCR